MEALTAGSKTYGQFGGRLWALENAGGPTLAEMAVKAVEILDGGEGFFLMIEAAHIDKLSHENRGAEVKEAILAFDAAVAAMLAFAEEDGETLLVVTADHETGAILYQNGSYVFTSGDHSNADVPLFVYGSSNFIKNGQTVQNKDIAIFMAMSLGITRDEFPLMIKKEDELLAA